MLSHCFAFWFFLHCSVSVVSHSWHNESMSSRQGNWQRSMSGRRKLAKKYVWQTEIGKEICLADTEIGKGIFLAEREIGKGIYMSSRQGNWQRTVVRVLWFHLFGNSAAFSLSSHCSQGHRGCQDPWGAFDLDQGQVPTGCHSPHSLAGSEDSWQSTKPQHCGPRTVYGHLQ